MALLSGYLAIASAYTPASGAFTELSGNGYAREAVTLTYDTVLGTVYSTGATFPTATGTWTAGTTLGIYDASTNGNLLFAFAYPTTAVASGANVTVPGFSILPAKGGAWASSAFPGLSTFGYLNGPGGATVYTGPSTLSVSSAGALSAANGVITLTDGTSITVDCSTGSYFSVTIGATGRTVVFKNAAAGQVVELEVVQDATGSRTITTYTGATFAGGTLPTLSTAASSVDLLRFTYNPVAGKFRGEKVGLAFA